MNNSNKISNEDYYKRTAIIGIFLYVGVIVALVLIDTVLSDWFMNILIFSMIGIICMILGLLRIDKVVKELFI